MGKTKKSEVEVFEIFVLTEQGLNYPAVLVCGRLSFATSIIVCRPICKIGG
ncbi:MAG: hypothetical protein ISR72_07685 [Methylobacter sp.]|nr:hypothetical protein [Methylobacter sp.]